MVLASLLKVTFGLVLLVSQSLTQQALHRSQDQPHWGLVLEGPVSRPVQDQKKTGPRPVFNKDCSLGLSKFKTKDRRKTGPYGPVLDRFKPVFCSPQLPLQM